MKSRYVTHSSYPHGLRTHELRLQYRIAILEKHGDHFFEVPAQLILRCTLRVRARPPGDVTNKQTSVWIAFDDSGERAHARNIACVFSRAEPSLPQPRLGAAQLMP
jgi:hypothetical protein